MTTAVVRDMLGLADRGQTIGLFEQAMRGEAGEAIATFRTLYGYGVDPVVVMLDLLDHCAWGVGVAQGFGSGGAGPAQRPGGAVGGGGVGGRGRDAVAAVAAAA